MVNKSIIFITNRNLKDFTLKKYSRKVIVNNNRIEKVINYCRKHKLNFDLLPLSSANYFRIANLCNAIKKVE